MSLSRIYPAALVVISCAWHSAIAQPKQAVEIGILACGFSAPRLAEASGASIAAQVVDVLCSFRLRSGAEETYSGKLLMVSLSSDHNGTLLWLVKAPFAETMPAPGLLQQSYVPDAKPAAEQIPALIGEGKVEIVLQSMADNNERGTGAPGKSQAGDFAILGLELKLQSTAG